MCFPITMCLIWKEKFVFSHKYVPHLCRSQHQKRSVGVEYEALKPAEANVEWALNKKQQGYNNKYDMPSWLR